jgi:hypothetical protein
LFILVCKFSPQAIVDLQRVSFLLSDGMLQKVRTSMAGPFEQLKGRIIEVPQPQNSARQQTVQQQIQQGTDYFNTAGL